jgi:hypothetical protein
VVPGHDLDEATADFLKEYEVLDTVEEAVWLAGAPDQRLQGDHAPLRLASVAFSRPLSVSGDAIFNSSALQSQA